MTFCNGGSKVAIARLHGEVLGVADLSTIITIITLITIITIFITTIVMLEFACGRPTVIWVLMVIPSLALTSQPQLLVQMPLAAELHKFHRRRIHLHPCPQYLAEFLRSCEYGAPNR